MTCFVL
jgi:hypothetical protein